MQAMPEGVKLPQSKIIDFCQPPLKSGGQGSAFSFMVVCIHVMIVSRGQGCGDLKNQAVISAIIPLHAEAEKGKQSG